jgi:hypothetical protein
MHAPYVLPKKRGKKQAVRKISVEIKQSFVLQAVLKLALCLDPVKKYFLVNGVEVGTLEISRKGHFFLEVCLAWHEKTSHFYA